MHCYFSYKIKGTGFNIKIQQSVNVKETVLITGQQLFNSTVPSILLFGAIFLFREIRSPLSRSIFQIGCCFRQVEGCIILEKFLQIFIREVAFYSDISTDFCLNQFPTSRSLLILWMHKQESAVVKYQNSQPIIIQQCNNSIFFYIE